MTDDLKGSRNLGRFFRGLTYFHSSPPRFLSGYLAISLISFAPCFSAAAAQERAPAAPAASASAFPGETSKLGVRKCAGLYSALGQAVSHGSNYTVTTQVDPSAPDAHAVQGVLGMTYSSPDYKGQAAGAVLAAPVGNRCEGQLVRVAPFQRSCADTTHLLPPGSTAAGELSGVPLYNLGGNQGQALLVPSGASCVVVTVTRMVDLK